MGGCYPQSDGQSLERHPQLAFDLLSRRSKGREKYGKRLPPGQKAVEDWPEEEPGFWEMYGYHIRGDPWNEERYS